VLKPICLVFLLSLTFQYSHSGNDNYPIGSRSAGVANASLSYTDVWSLWQNQAGIANLKQITLGTFYEDKFLIPDLALEAFGIVIPSKNLGVFGFSYTGFGNAIYNEKKAGMAYAKSYAEILSFAIQLDYLNTYIGNGYGSHNAFAAEAGFQAKILPELVLAAHIYNPSRTKLSSYDNETIPTILRVGLAYTFSDRVICSIETEKDVTQEANFKAGLEYHAAKQFYLRAGISTNPLSDAFGFGLDIKELRLDFSETIYQQFGNSPTISLSYKFK
jgi:hypothetical protein